MCRLSDCHIDMNNDDDDGSTLHSSLHVYYGNQEELPVAHCYTHECITSLDYPAVQSFYK
jgi:hypothetical protein